MIERLIANPMPSPSGFVVTKAVKIRSRSCGSMPTPASCTATRMASVSSGCDRMINSRGRSVTAAHGFHAVQHQIQEHLLQLNAIAQHGGEIGRQVGLQRHPVAAHLAVGQGDDLAR